MLAAKLLAKRSLQVSGSWCKHQQLRFGSTKTFGLRYRYGVAPFTSTDKYLEAQESGQLDSLKYESVRFALSTETTSVLSEPKVEQLIAYSVRHGKRALLQHMVHESFYHIKKIQYGKLLRREKKKAAAAASGDKSESSKSGPRLEEEEEESIEMDPVAILKQALINMQPAVITRKITRGGATYNVPYPLVDSTGQYLAIKWLVEVVMDRPRPRHKHFPEVLAQEILDGYANTGKVVKRKDDLHRLAVANKPFAHYRWG